MPDLSGRSPPTSLTRLKIEGWKSEFKSVQKVLDHLREKGSGYEYQTYGSVETYADVFSRYIEFVKQKHPQLKDVNPNSILELPKSKSESLLEEYIDHGVTRNLSKKTVATWRYNVLLHYQCSRKRLDVKKVRIPPRYRRRKEHTPTPTEVLSIADAAKTNRDRAMILCLYTSGIRDSTFRAIRYKDVKADLDSGRDTVFVPIYPEMKKLDDRACKGNIPYYSFFDRLSTQALRAYLRERERQHGKTEDEMVLFMTTPSRARTSFQRAAYKPISKNGLNRVIKEAAHNAGLLEWELIHAHSFRYAFEDAIKHYADGSVVDPKDQQFLLGHVLPGTEDPYYGSGVSVQGSVVTFKKDVCEKLRGEYEKIALFPPRLMLTEQDVETKFKEQFLVTAGMPKDEIARLGDLAAKSPEQISEIGDEWRKQELEKNGQKDRALKVTPAEDVLKMIKKGLRANRQRQVPLEEMATWLDAGWVRVGDPYQINGVWMTVVGVPSAP